MRIAAVVCEYNPFHNGHKYQLERIRAESGCDKILCLMSGCFTQRGDMALFDKYTRARHASWSFPQPLPRARPNSSRAGRCISSPPSPW